MSTIRARRLYASSCSIFRDKCAASADYRGQCAINTGQREQRPAALSRRWHLLLLSIKWTGTQGVSHWAAGLLLRAPISGSPCRNPTRTDVGNQLLTDTVRNRSTSFTFRVPIINHAVQELGLNWSLDRGRQCLRYV